MTEPATRNRNMTIGELARRAGVGVQTVRYYERRRLLPAAARRSSGYREFTPAALDRLRFIRRAQELGFTLAEIAELLALRLDPHTTAADVKARASRKIHEIDEKMRDLDRIRRALAHLAGRCRAHGPTGDCPLMDALGPLDETAFADTALRAPGPGARNTPDTHARSKV
ncbi:MAG TPA: heavy metal-responsive transcriptional regulator [Gemmatimonadales bacterium]|nr:heavy metal-responsive transcriptional regulator [Gemmatimonadales bacterium]